MITVKGIEWGTADEIAAALGPDITPKRVHDWAQRGLIARHNLPGQGRGITYFRLDQAAAAERDTRLSTRGRRRQLDITPALT